MTLLKSPREISGGVSFLLENRLQLCNFAHKVLSQKNNILKVSNRNTRKRCLLISKITSKASERRHLTTSYLPGVTVQNHVIDSFSKNIYQFAIKSLLSVLLSSSTDRNSNNSRPISVILWEMRNNYLIFDAEKVKISAFFISKKAAPKMDKVFNFLPYIQTGAISVLQS